VRRDLNDWWAEEDKASFVARAAVMVKQAGDTVVHTQARGLLGTSPKP
jgi:predicted metalloendopeptidase